MMKTLIAVLSLLGIVVAAAGCNTVAGAGADVKAAGSGIEKAADKAKPY